MMTQGLLPFQCEAEGSSSKATSVAGLLPYAELAVALRLREAADEMVGVSGQQGWSDAGMVLALVLMVLAGGECVEDLERLGRDAGFVEMMRHGMTVGLTSRQRRQYRRRFRRGGQRGVPSTSATYRYLEGFVDEQAEAGRGAGHAFIVTPSAGLLGLRLLNAYLLGHLARQLQATTATLDQDATLIATEKRDALYGYKHFRCYQPLNVWWDELRVMLHTEFRDGNVPAGFHNLRVLKEALELLPPSVRQVRLRTDTAGYEIELLRYLAEGKNERFGVIEFAIGVDVTEEFRRAVVALREQDWQPLPARDVDGSQCDTGQQWAEVCFVPNSLSTKKNGATYRFLAIREPLGQLELPGLEQQQPLPFPTADFTGGRYKLFGVVTNRNLPGPELIRWHRLRCGHSEQAHAVLKSDLAGGRMPSGRFGANAAWWWISILAHNLDSALRLLVLGPAWLGRRMKAVRFLLINVAARIQWRARCIKLCLATDSPLLHLLHTVRHCIAKLATGPPR